MRAEEEGMTQDLQGKWCYGSPGEKTPEEQAEGEPGGCLLGVQAELADGHDFGATDTECTEHSRDHPGREGGHGEEDAGTAQGLEKDQRT